jgi:hypothetical protein
VVFERLAVLDGREADRQALLRREGHEDLAADDEERESHLGGRVVDEQREQFSLQFGGRVHRIRSVERHQVVNVFACHRLCASLHIVNRDTRRD